MTDWSSGQFYQIELTVKVILLTADFHRNNDNEEVFENLVNLVNIIPTYCILTIMMLKRGK